MSDNLSGQKIFNLSSDEHWQTQVNTPCNALWPLHFVFASRDDAFCIPDESYVGTVVHSHLDNASDVDGNITMLRLNTGKGFDAASISEEFLLEIRGSITTSGPASRGNGGVGQQDWHGHCKDATLRWVPMLP